MTLESVETSSKSFIIIINFIVKSIRNQHLIRIIIVIIIIVIVIVVVIIIILVGIRVLLDLLENLAPCRDFHPIREKKANKIVLHISEALRQLIYFSSVSTGAQENAPCSSCSGWSGMLCQR